MSTDPRSVALSGIGKAIDNSGVIRERDPRASRDVRHLLLLVALFVGGMVLYAWPHFELRQTGVLSDRLQRERERLVEENRKLQLEKASLENLKRVESIARRDLHLATPAARDVYVVERSAAPASSEAMAALPASPVASPEVRQ
ncbi:MAG: cell division protein FtsL [Vicinamibacteria bacterium]|nr:cell division protein FtsL [Vicinamibacteria bacterium]